MTTREVTEMIASIGLPYAYYQFPENTAQAPPVICFYYPKSRNFHADDEVYTRAEELIIELYTPEKRFDLEAKVEEALNAYGLTWRREENFLKSEHLIVEVYRTVVPLRREE
ncbi:MAG: hypothetical protein IJR72_03770 [Oscillospiraceae bacterium]|nr:hypothetical protein [Oscillospiraceae bacterium]